jgi:hypothetical protein
MSQTSLLSFSNVDTVIRDSAFYGNATGTAVVEAVNFGGVKISDTEFLDYGHFDGDYYSKSAYGNPAWVKLTTTARVSPSANGQLPVSISNVRFDEGAHWAMDISGVPYVELMGVMDNVSGVDGGGGIRFSGVKYAEVKMSMFGYTPSARPAIEALNKSTVYVDSMSVGNGVFYGRRDSTSQVSFNTRACADCSFELDNASKISLAPRR